MHVTVTPTELGKKNLKASRLNATLCYLAMESKIDTAIEHCTLCLRGLVTSESGAVGVPVLLVAAVAVAVAVI